MGVGFVTLAALFTVPETLAPERRNREPLTRTLANYRFLIENEPATNRPGLTNRTARPTSPTMPQYSWPIGVG